MPRGTFTMSPSAASYVLPGGVIPTIKLKGARLTLADPLYTNQSSSASVWSFQGSFVVLLAARSVMAKLVFTTRSCESCTCASAASTSAFVIRWGNRFVFGPDETVIVIGNPEGAATGVWARIEMGSKAHTLRRANRPITNMRRPECLMDLVLSLPCHVRTDTARRAAQ